VPSSRRSVYWHSSVRKSGACRVLAVDFGAHSISSPSSTHLRAHSSEAQHGMCRVSYLWRTQHMISPFSSPLQKLLSKSSSRGLKYLERHYWRPPDKPQKVCLHSGLISRGCCYWMANGPFVFTDAKHRPHGAIGSEVEGVGNATTGSVTDKLTREHRMTLDEAHLILNTKREEAVEQILQVRPFVRTLSIAAPSQLFVTRITNTCSKPTRRWKRHLQTRQGDGARRYLGIHTTCSQRWCGHESGSRQSWRYLGKSRRQQRQVKS
jgi:hypothetical protein